MANKLLILSLIQSIYVIYVLNYFKTKYNFAHPLSNFSSDYFRHPIGKSKNPSSKVCKFGKQSSWVLAIFIILRFLLIYFLLENDCIKMISIISLTITFILSLLNFNVIIYLIPYFIIEIYLIKYLL
jgi:hypothetical protein